MGVEGQEEVEETGDLLFGFVQGAEPSIRSAARRRRVGFQFNASACKLASNLPHANIYASLLYLSISLVSDLVGGLHSHTFLSTLQAIIISFLAAQMIAGLRYMIVSARSAC